MAISPIEFLREGIKAVPAVKYALGVGAIASVAVIILGFGINPYVAIIGTIIIIVLMFVLLVFSNLTKRKKPGPLQPAGIMLTWVFCFLVAIFSTFLVSGLFFNWPKPIPDIFPIPFEPTIQGIVRNQNGIGIEGAQITVEDNQFSTITGTDGKFSGELEGVKKGEQVTIKVNCDNFQSLKKTFNVNDTKIKLDILLKPLEQMVFGVILDSNGIGIEGAKITIDANPFEATTGTDGTFRSILKGEKQEEFVKIRVFHTDYQSWNGDILVSDLNKQLRINLNQLIQ